MEIGTEISRKIRTAIKGKLQELGAYADEELPDYIMVMVANKKTQDQMAEDLALFLGNNTVKFTAWLHGVLDKLRSVTVEPTTLKQQSNYSDCNLLLSTEKSQAAVSGSIDQNNDVRILAVSSTLSERNDSRVSTSSLQEQAIPAIRLVKLKLNAYIVYLSCLCMQDENSRKRKAAIISSVVKVSKTSDGEEDDDDYGTRTGSLPSSISVPAKPERRPTLPPSKQANKNLILKAITEAQKSVSKTTNYPPVSQRQTVPVAPRTRAVCESNEIEVINVEDKPDQHGVQLQIDKAEQPVQKLYLKSIEARPGGDTRSFILKKPVLEGVEPKCQGKVAVYIEGVSAEQDRVVQAKDQRDSEESSPKFIVTLDGIPSPPGYSSEQEEETEIMEQGGLLQEAGRKYRLSIQNAAQSLKESDEEIDDPNFQVKRQKVLERCKYWPACKNGDECMYHHPVASCKTFPKCKFGDKCLFIHPNCKYDSKCIRSDCPYTHASKRTAVLQKQPAPATSPSSSLCRFFPDCKKVECPFIHPKPCRFSTHCKRADCTFYHPAVTLPPRHALKWTRSQQNGE
ncbi:zinc finger CCCH domain-containing protein 14 [Rhincodon typus]|uniref:zinc finger CCCH domain-containing protein 14 n=1 Tax=Rhincodon typus TaxID=259920 RepID=UPI002030936A|nr:zinc finger CCCH domain-containing protein 14 [Rhincodon typus]